MRLGKRCFYFQRLILVSYIAKMINQMSYNTAFLRKKIITYEIMKFTKLIETRARERTIFDNVRSSRSGWPIRLCEKKENTWIVFFSEEFYIQTTFRKFYCNLSSQLQPTSENRRKSQNEFTHRNISMSNARSWLINHDEKAIEITLISSRHQSRRYAK